MKLLNKRDLSCHSESMKGLPESKSECFAIDTMSSLEYPRNLARMRPIMRGYLSEGICNLRLQTGAVQKNVQYCEICAIIETLANM